MIERHWKGIAHKDSAKEYVDHLLLDTFPSLESIEGYRGAAILSRNLNEGTEFLVITRWESIEVISRFAGEAVTFAVVPDVVKRMMVQYDQHAVHYDVLKPILPTHD